jgi:hypothetical protein
MKYISTIILTTLIAVLMTGCGLSKEDIGKTVKTSMQETLSSDSNFKKYNLTVNDVSVFQKGDNTYKGLASIEYKGTSHDVSVEILVDGGDVMWEAKPGAFMFIAQDELQQIQNLFQ